MAAKPATALELLSDPTKWIKGSYAHDKDGHLVSPSRPEACSWCLEGALVAVYGYGGMLDRESTVAAALPEEIMREWTVGSKRLVPFFNDHPKTTHAMVLEVLQKAGL